MVIGPEMFSYKKRFFGSFSSINWMIKFSSFQERFEFIAVMLEKHCRGPGRLFKGFILRDNLSIFKNFDYSALTEDMIYAILHDTMHIHHAS